MKNLGIFFMVFGAALNALLASGAKAEAAKVPESSAAWEPKEVTSYWKDWIAAQLRRGQGKTDNPNDQDLHPTIPFNYGQAAIPFVELTLDDMVDQSLAGKMSPDAIVMVEINHQQIILPAKELLGKLNGIERRLSEVGKSLRNEMSTLVVSAIPNPEIWVRELRRGTDFSLKSVVDHFQLSAVQCPSIVIGSLGINPATAAAWTAADSVDIPGQGTVKIADLLPKLNNEQSTLCSLGLTMLDKLEPQAPTYLRDLMVKRVELLASLNVDSSSALYEVAQWAKGASFDQVRKDYDRIADLVQHPTPAKLYVLAQKGAAGTGALALPDIPSVPAPQVAKRVDLALKKRLEWPGFSIGNQDIASAYANGWAELRSGKAADAANSPVNQQALQAEAKFGLYLISNQINLLGATLDSALDPSNAKAEMTYCYLDICTTKKGGVTDFGISAGDPELLAKDWAKDYEQQLMVGIIPVVVRFGGAFSAKLGWGLGLNLLSVKGGINGSLSASAMGEAAVGVQDFVEAGFGGSVTLIRDTISINGDAEVKFLSDEQPVIEASLTGDNAIDSLDGKVYAYAMLDALGPIGEYLDKIVDGLKALGDGQLGDFLGRIGKTSAIGKKLVTNMQAAGRDIGKEWNKGVGEVTKVFGGCCKLSGAASLVGATPFGGMTISGTKIRYQQDWDWHGSHTTSRFLNYKIYIGPDGRQYGGDLGSYDSDADTAVQENIMLAQREVAATEAETTLAVRKKAVLADVETFLAADATAAISALPGALHDNASRIHTLAASVFQRFREAQ